MKIIGIIADIIIITTIVTVVLGIPFRNRKKKECEGCPYCDSCGK